MTANFVGHIVPLIDAKRRSHSTDGSDTELMSIAANESVPSYPIVILILIGEG
jgi:hypothetical protein